MLGTETPILTMFVYAFLILMGIAIGKDGKIAELTANPTKTILYIIVSIVIAFGVMTVL